MRPASFGDVTSARGHQAGSVHRWWHKRRGMAAGAVAAALLVALAVLRRDSGPMWVAAAVPMRADTVAGSGKSAAVMSGSASAGDGLGKGSAPAERREALQQSASAQGTSASSGAASQASAEHADAGSSGSGGGDGSSHTRGSKASKAAGDAAGSASAAGADENSPEASAHPDEQSTDSAGAADPAAGGADGAADDAPDNAPDDNSQGSGTGNDTGSEAASGPSTDATQAVGQPGEAGNDSSKAGGEAPDHAPQQPESERTAQQADSTSAAADPDAQEGSKVEADGPSAEAEGSQPAEHAAPEEQSGDDSADTESAPAPHKAAAKQQEQQPEQPAERQDSAAAKAAPREGNRHSQRPRPAHPSFGPIQPALLAAVEAAVNPDGAVMLAVTNKEGALFQLPQLLSSMRLVPQEDITRYLVVVTYSAPAQAACLRQHAACVLDDFGTGGLGGDGGDGIDAFAGWGSRRFKGITWRKIQLVQDILLQGYAVLSVDLDIVLFKNPLDPAFNPLMNRELDAWVAVDNGKMLNCGFYFMRPTEPTDKFMKEWLGRFNLDAADDIWEQAEFNQILKGAHATMPQLRWDKLDEEWFVDLCFYLDARAVLPDQKQFGELFAATSDKLGNWDKMFGFHAACCKGGGPALPECKRSTATALMMWQIHAQPSEWPQ